MPPFYQQKTSTMSITIEISLLLLGITVLLLLLLLCLLVRVGWPVVQVRAYIEVSGWPTAAKHAGTRQ